MTTLMPPDAGSAAEVDLDFDASANLYATHPLHAFAARCPPPLVRWAIERFSKRGDVVLDPMCGSGTTLVEAALAGRSAWGVDIDPLARLVTEAKATPADPRAVRGLADRLEVRLAADGLDDSWRPELPDLDKWFLGEVADDLARLRAAITGEAPEGSTRALAWAVFSSLIVARTSVANARDLVHSRHHYRRWETNPGTAGRFLRQLRRAAVLHEDYRHRLGVAGNPTPEARVVGIDARRLRLDDDSVDLVFTSPPYCSALDYTRAHMFAVAWLADVLGLSTAQYRALGRRYVGSERAALTEATAERPLPPPSGDAGVDAVVEALSEDPRRAWIVHRYFADMAAVLGECARVVRPGGRVVLVVCPSNIRKVRIPTHEFFAALAPGASDGALEVEHTHERTIHDGRRVMPYLEASFGERMRTEYVVVLRRPLGAPQGRLPAPVTAAAPAAGGYA